MYMQEARSALREEVANNVRYARLLKVSCPTAADAQE
jgi:hypothetical protein